MAPASLTSGIQRLDNGEGVIPSSTRADGSVRKEIRVKPGYRPPEDVELYKNRTAEAWKNRGKGGVPGAEVASSTEKTLPHDTKAAAQNARRKEARRKAAIAAAEKHGAANGSPSTNGGSSVNDNDAVAPMEQDVDPEAEKAKEARKLAKKLRQARELREKEQNGNSLLPEQFAKVIKINELIRQLNHLGFDAEGEKKQPRGEVSAPG